MSRVEGAPNRAGKPIERLELAAGSELDHVYRRPSLGSFRDGPQKEKAGGFSCRLPEVRQRRNFASYNHDERLTSPD